jgi:protein-S-isoprenylcysteine O-methyltransferase Ste14
MESSTDDLRALATKRLKKKADFKSFLVVWLFVSAVVTVIWFFATPGILFWPGFVIAGMGLAAVFIWWDAYGPNTGITEADINAEIERMKRKP